METKAKIFEVTPTISAAQYADLDHMGDCKEITSAMDDSTGTAMVVSLAVIDSAKQSSAMDVLFFDEEPTITSSDNAALDIADAEMVGKYLGRIKIAAADYVNLANCSVVTYRNLQLMVKAAKNESKSLWVLCQARGTPTYAATNAITLKIGIIQY